MKISIRSVNNVRIGTEVFAKIGTRWACIGEMKEGIIHSHRVFGQEVLDHEFKPEFMWFCADPAEWCKNATPALMVHMADDGLDWHKPCVLI